MPLFQEQIVSRLFFRFSNSNSALSKIGFSFGTKIVSELPFFSFFVLLFLVKFQEGYSFPFVVQTISLLFYGEKRWPHFLKNWLETYRV